LKDMFLRMFASVPPLEHVMRLGRWEIVQQTFCFT